MAKQPTTLCAAGIDPGVNSHRLLNGSTFEEAFTCSLSATGSRPLAATEKTGQSSWSFSVPTADYPFSWHLCRTQRDHNAAKLAGSSGAEFGNCFSVLFSDGPIRHQSFSWNHFQMVCCTNISLAGWTTSPPIWKPLILRLAISGFPPMAWHEQLSSAQFFFGWDVCPTISASRLFDARNDWISAPVRYLPSFFRFFSSLFSLFYSCK